MKVSGLYTTMHLSWCRPITTHYICRSGCCFPSSGVQLSSAEWTVTLGATFHFSDNEMHLSVFCVCMIGVGQCLLRKERADWLLFFFLYLNLTSSSRQRSCQGETQCIQSMSYSLSIPSDAILWKINRKESEVEWDGKTEIRAAEFLALGKAC